jgi:hypothetical protein
MRRIELAVLIVLLLIPRPAAAQGDPIGPEFRVNTYTTDYQGGSSVARAPGGGFVVVWTSSLQDGSFRGVFGQRYDSSGAPLGPEFQVNTYTTFDQTQAAVAADATGNFVVVWRDSGQDGSGFGVFGQRFAASGSPQGAEFRVNSSTVGYQSEPDVAFGPSGNFIVVWQDAVGPASGVFGQRYAGSGAPLGPEFQMNVAASIGDPSVATDGSDNFVVAGRGGAGGGSGTDVFAQRYASSGSPLGAAFLVNTYTTQDQLLPAVAADAAGGFVVVWCSAGQEGDPGGGGGGPPLGVYGQRYASSGNPLGPEFRINTYTTDNQWFPAVVTDAAGDFVVVWNSDQYGLDTGVFGQRYDNAGVPLGGEFRVNTYTTASSALPTVAADSAGHFVVTWTSAQEGLSAGVFAQRYSQIVPVELMQFGIE